MIGIAVIAGTIVLAMADYAGARFAMQYFQAPGITFNAEPHLNVFAILCGATIIAIAEVFRAGAALEDEQSLTI